MRFQGHWDGISIHPRMACWILVEVTDLSRSTAKHEFYVIHLRHQRPRFESVLIALNSWLPVGIRAPMFTAQNRCSLSFGFRLVVSGMRLDDIFTSTDFHLFYSLGIQDF